MFEFIKIDGVVKSRKRDFQPQHIVVVLDVEHML